MHRDPVGRTLFEKLLLGIQSLHLAIVYTPNMSQVGFIEKVLNGLTVCREYLGFRERFQYDFGPTLGLLEDDFKLVTSSHSQSSKSNTYTATHRCLEVTAPAGKGETGGKISRPSLLQNRLLPYPTILFLSNDSHILDGNVYLRPRTNSSHDAAWPLDQ